MSRRNTEPVRHTCPDIDKIIQTITDITNQMSICDNDDNSDSLMELINEWKIDLQTIGIGGYCEMEKLRSSNHSLREWGNEMYDDAENLEDQVNDLKNKVDDLENQVSDYEK